MLDLLEQAVPTLDDFYREYGRTCLLAYSMEMAIQNTSALFEFALQESQIESGVRDRFDPKALQAKVFSKTLGYNIKQIGSVSECSEALNEIFGVSLTERNYVVHKLPSGYADFASDETVRCAAIRRLATANTVLLKGAALARELYAQQDAIFHGKKV